MSVIFEADSCLTPRWRDLPMNTPINSQHTVWGKVLRRMRGVLEPVFINRSVVILSIFRFAAERWTPYLDAPDQSDALCSGVDRWRGWRDHALGHCGPARSYPVFSCLLPCQADRAGWARPERQLPYDALGASIVTTTMDPTVNQFSTITRTAYQLDGTVRDATQITGLHPHLPTTIIMQLSVNLEM